MSAMHLRHRTGVCPKSSRKNNKKNHRLFKFYIYHKTDNPIEQEYQFPLIPSCLNFEQKPENPLYKDLLNFLFLNRNIYNLYIFPQIIIHIVTSPSEKAHI